MANASPAQLSFNRGELSPRLEGRVDLPEYPFGLRQMQNFLPTIQGSAQKRPGFRWVKEVKDSSKKTRAVAFEFSTTQAYILEFGDQYMRVYRNSQAQLESGQAITGATQANPVVVTATAHGFSNGEEVFIENVGGMTEINDRFFPVANVTANTFELQGEDGTSHTAYTSGGTASRVFETATPYLEADLEGLQFAQSADVLYVAHKSYAPRKVERTGHTAWTITQIAFDWVPFAQENLDEDDFIIASSDKGSITLTSTGGHFVSGHAGGYLRLRERFESNHQEWKAGDDHSQLGTSINVGQGVWYEGNVYELLDKHGQGVSGETAPTHRKGTRSDGLWRWNFIHSGAGYVQIDSVTDAYRASATVIKQIPRACTDGDKTITGATQANPVRITISGAHGYETGDKVYIQDVGGMTEINQRVFTITVTGSTIFDLDDEDGTGHTAYTSGGIAVRADTVINLDNMASAPFDWRDHDLWSFGAFSDERGYPRAVTFFDDRLWWFGTKSDPQSAWGSKVSDFENHETEPPLDTSAIFVTLNTDQVNVIEWVSAGEQILIGTAGGEFALSAASITDPITPGNARAVRQSTYGVKAETPPIRIEQVVLFVQRAGRKVRELVFDEPTNSFVAPDLTALAEHIAVNRIRKMAFQQEPDRLLWCYTHTGELIAMTYERQNQVVAWHAHPVGGTDVEVESVAVIPHPDQDSDQLWAVVKRTINGGTKRYMEVLEKVWVDTNAQEDAFFVDSGITYDGPSTTTIGNLHHLEGESVVALVKRDSSGLVEVEEGLTVSGGELTLSSAVTKAQIGLEYTGLLETMRVEAGGADGVSQGKIGRIERVVLRLYQAGGTVEYGPSSSTLEPFEVAAGTLQDGDTEFLRWPGGYEQERRMVVRHNAPLPCTVTAIFPHLQVEDT